MSALPTVSDLLDQLIAAPVEDRARVLAASGDAAGNLATMIEHAGKMALTDAGKANDATDALVNLADRMGTQLDRARARRGRARALSYAGKFREALFACEEGLRLAEEAGSAIDVGRTRLASMHALGELGRLDEAIAAGEAARSDFLAVGEANLAARADLNIGTAHQRSDQPAIAIRCFDRARPLLLAEPMVLGPLDNNRGEALLAINDFAGAEAAFTQALATFRETRAAMAQAIVEGNLADLAARQGRLQRALLHFEQARRAFEGQTGTSKSIDSPHLARLRAERAEAMAMLGMPTEALTEYEHALVELDRHGLALEAARARSGMGLTLLRLNRPAAAETALAAAATAFDELKHATARARVDLLRAELAAMNGRFADARQMALRALAALHERPSDSAVARLLLGRLAIEAGHLDEADAELNHALAIGRRLDLAPLQADVLHQRGLLRRTQDRLADAIADFAAAVEQVERIRGTLQADRFRAAFLGERSAMYEDLVDALLELHETGDTTAIGRAFAAIEQAKSRILLEQMDRDLGDESAPSDGATANQDSMLLERLRAARADLNALYSVLGDDKPRDADHARQWRERVQQREREVDEIETRLATTTGVGGLFVVTATLEDALVALPSGTAVIEYFTVGQSLGALVLRDGRAHVHRRLADLSDIESRLAAVQFQINRALRPGAMQGDRGTRLTSDARRELAALADLIVRPLRGHLADAARLTIVPHGRLHAVPFAALSMDDRWLIEDHEISTAPSARLLLRLRAADATGVVDRSRALIVGVADEHAPHIGDEARLVANIFAKCATSHELLLDERATVGAVMHAATEADVLHLACHGRYAPDSPLGSGLRLADRWLTVRDMLSLRLKARLVTLSGCETGLSSVHPGDELLGLQRGVFAAGTRAVLASLWRVDDEITREWMTAFYGSLHTVAGRQRVAHALQAAQVAVMRRHPHPAHWAPFTLAGLP